MWFGRIWRRLRGIDSEPTADQLLAESAWSRAVRDARRRILGFFGVATEVIVTAGAGVLMGSAVASIVGFFAVAGVVFVASLIAAPLAQRNEARSLLAERSRPDDEAERRKALRDLLAVSLHGVKAVRTQTEWEAFWTWTENTKEFIRQAFGLAEAELFADVPVSAPRGQAHIIVTAYADNLRNLIGSMDAKPIESDFEPGDWDVGVRTGPERRRAGNA